MLRELHTIRGTTNANYNDENVQITRNLTYSTNSNKTTIHKHTPHST